jgi:hypothetical protein
LADADNDGGEIGLWIDPFSLPVSIDEARTA